MYRSTSRLRTGFPVRCHAVVDQGHGEGRWKSWCFEECGEGGYELIVSHIHVYGRNCSTHEDKM